MDITIIIERIKETMKEYFPLKEDIPTKTSDLVNDVGFLIEHQDITNKENISNKTTSLSSLNTNTQYPSAKCVYDNLIPKLEEGYTNNINDSYSSSTTPLSQFMDITVNNYDNLSTNIDWSNGNLQCNNDVTFHNKSAYTNIKLTLRADETNIFDCTVWDENDNKIEGYILTKNNQDIYFPPGKSLTFWNEAGSNNYIYFTYQIKADTINTIAAINYPKGSTYTRIDNTNPMVLFGGRWENITSETNNYKWKRTK